MMAFGFIAALLVVQPEIPWVDREPAGLILVRTDRFSGATSRSELLEATASAAEEATWLKLTLIEAARVDTCLNDNPAAGLLFCQVQTALNAEDDRKVLFLVSATGAGEESSVRTGALWLPDARPVVTQVLEKARRTSDLEEVQVLFDEAEQNLLDQFKLQEPALARYPQELEQALNTTLRAATTSLPEGGDLRRNGDLVLQTNPREAQVTVDERELGIAPPEGLRVTGLQPGSHNLRVEKNGFYALRKAFEIPTAGELELTLDLTRSYQTSWRTTAWTGIGIAAAGLGVGIYGAVEAPNRNRPFSSSQLIRLVGTGDGVSTESQQGDGPLVLGLSLGLVVTGATMAVFGLTAKEPKRPPWLEILLSLGGGLLTYGVIELANAAS